MGQFVSDENATPDADKIQPFLLERYPNAAISITVTGSKLEALDIPSLNDADFNALLIDLQREFPGAYNAQKTFIPIEFRNPNLSTPNFSGSAYPNVESLSSWDASTMSFNSGSIGKWYGIVSLPVNLATPSSGSIVLRLAVSGSVGGNTVFQVATTLVSSSMGYNFPTFLTEAGRTITFPSNSLFERTEVWFPQGGNLATGLQSGNELFIQVTRSGSHASDTLTYPVHMFNAVLKVNVVR